MSLVPWSNEITFEFLEHYKNARPIWDLKHPSHKNRKALCDAWDEICAIMSIDCTVEELKKKKESLMASYRSHKRRKERNSDYKPCWFAFETMDSFLGVLYGGEESLDDSCSETVDADHHYRRNSSGNDIKPPAKQIWVTHQSKPQKRSRDDFSYAKRQMNEAVTCLKTAVGGRDEIELYGLLLVKKLRKLDEHQRDIAMHEIDNIMFRVKTSCPSASTPAPRKVESPMFIDSQENEAEYLEEEYHEDPIEDSE